MADTDEDDGYSDDDLDALAPDAFLELQQDALRSTQRPNSHTQGSIHRPGVLGLTEGFGHVSIRQQNATGHEYPVHPSSDYGDLDEEMLDGEILDAGTQRAITGQRGNALAPRLVSENKQREQWRQQRYGDPVPAHFVQKLQDHQSIPQRLAAHGARVQASASRDDRVMEIDDEAQAMHEESEEVGNVEQNEDLQLYVEKLVRERDTLQQELETANSNALSKAGEIAIIRANHVKIVKEYEKKSSELQKIHAGEAARQRVEIEKARAEKERVATEIEFLKRDLFEETERVRNLTKNAKAGGVKPPVSKTAGNDIVTTPKKVMVLPYRDGFDDDEIMVVSPSKAASKSKAVTPKAGAKRKRKPTEDSPAQPLHLSQPKRDDGPRPTDSLRQSPSDAVEHLQPIPKTEDTRFEFTQQILNHRLHRGHKRSFEVLANYVFPSNADKPLSTLLLDEISLLGLKQNVADFPAAVGHIVISLWSQCIKEEFYKPLELLIDLVKFILVLSTASTASHLIDEVVPLAQITADINAIPRHKLQPSSQLKEEISTNECLQILYLVACGCMRDVEDMIRFWRFMRFDFILMILGVKQPLDDIQLMLSLLRTSVLENSFATIVSVDAHNQRACEKHVINNMTLLLIDVPRVAEGQHPYDAIEVAELRLQVLDLMDKMCDTKHGGEALAVDPYAIGRLVRVMNDELDALYDYTYDHDFKADLVNHATRLLFHLISAYKTLVNMRTRLAAIPGGSHKHLIALTRLAFSEGTFFERGIEDEVVECAHLMLEEAVTPEEGEALLEAFSSAGG
ncbi:Protein of unknown function DUF3636 [Lasallia pustulata]|uniref:DNA repair protein Rad26 n=1 Tax=Lasallia pustulata TaxID=136370 RepID=A0A1W5D980_9LECA|nr:Protein of unknown function DUF3636 [Lasallia pustulata]